MGIGSRSGGPGNHKLPEAAFGCVTESGCAAICCLKRCWLIQCLGLLRHVIVVKGGAHVMEDDHLFHQVGLNTPEKADQPASMSDEELRTAPGPAKPGHHLQPLDAIDLMYPTSSILQKQLHPSIRRSLKALGAPCSIRLRLDEPNHVSTHRTESRGGPMGGAGRSAGSAQAVH